MTDPIRLYHSDVDHIEVWAQGDTRWLTFADQVMQSWIQLSDPAVLSPPVQALLAPLLFVPTPQKTLMLGMGAGSLARFLTHQKPEFAGVLVEWSAPAVAIARQFFDFPEASAWEIKRMDARDYLLNTTQQYDYVVVDMMTGPDTSRWVGQPAHLHRMRACLSPGGVVVFNLLACDATMFTNFLRHIRHVFARKTVCLGVPGYKNVVIFAFVQDPPYSTLAQLRARAPVLQQAWGLPFSALVAQMQQDNPPGSGALKE